MQYLLNICWFLKSWLLNFVACGAVEQRVCFLWQDSQSQLFHLPEVVVRNIKFIQCRMNMPWMLQDSWYVYRTPVTTELNVNMIKSFNKNLKKKQKYWIFDIKHYTLQYQACGTCVQWSGYCQCQHQGVPDW